MHLRKPFSETEDETHIYCGVYPWPEDSDELIYVGPQHVSEVKCRACLTKYIASLTEKQVSVNAKLTHASATLAAL